MFADKYGVFFGLEVSGKIELLLIRGRGLFFVSKSNGESYKKLKLKNRKQG